MHNYASTFSLKILSRFWKFILYRYIDTILNILNMLGYQISYVLYVTKSKKAGGRYLTT